MSRREIAVMLYGNEAVKAEWSDDRGAMKDAVKYLVTKAKGLRDGGYLIELLQHAGYGFEGLGIIKMN